MKNGLRGGAGGREGANEQHPSDVKTYNLARSISNYLYRIYLYPHQRRPTSCFLYPRFISHVHASQSSALTREKGSIYLSISLFLSPRLSTGRKSFRQIQFHRDPSLLSPFTPLPKRIFHDYPRARASNRPRYYLRLQPINFAAGIIVFNF